MRLIWIMLLAASLVTTQALSDSSVSRKYLMCGKPHFRSTAGDYQNQPSRQTSSINGDHIWGRFDVHGVDSQGYRLIDVGFLDGGVSSDLKHEVVKLANNWSASNYGGKKGAFVKFILAQEDSQEGARIRISLNGNNSSCLGNSSRLESNICSDWDDSFESMNLEAARKLKITTDSDELAYIKATVMHEFGHALGLHHELIHPKANINWNKPVIYQEYRGTGWCVSDKGEKLNNKQCDQKVDEQILQPLEMSFRWHTDKRDPLSIMNYWMSANNVCADDKIDLSNNINWCPDKYFDPDGDGLAFPQILEISNNELRFLGKYYPRLD